MNNFKPEQFELVITVYTFNFHQTFETTSKTYTLKVAFLLTGHYSRSRSWCSSGKGCVPWSIQVPPAHGNLRRLRGNVHWSVPVLWKERYAKQYIQPPVYCFRLLLSLRMEWWFTISSLWPEIHWCEANKSDLKVDLWKIIAAQLNTC